jgi:pimeloyl-ACP methyl ester carboxylesterase
LLLARAHDSRNGWTCLALAAQDAVVGASAMEAVVQPETKYAQLGRDRIAYQVVGQGPPDLVMTTASFGDIDVAWEDPGLALFYRTLASFSRLILLNRRGTGASDPLPPDPLPPWESYAEELAVVLDEVGSQRAALLATLDAGPTALFFAATRPGRTSALILAHTTARCVAADDYPIGVPAQVAEEVLGQVDQTPAMASWPPSMALPAGSAARPSSEMSCAAWGSGSGRGCMPARSSCATATSAASPCTSRPGSWRRPDRVTSLPPGPSATWWSAPTSPWRTAGHIH